LIRDVDMKSAARFLAIIMTITAICRPGMAGDAIRLNLTVSAPKADCVDVPLCAVIEVPETLAGDPEHAGFHYRAHNDVASGGKEVKATYLFPDDGVDPKKDKDLPWAAMSYGLNNQRYCVLHMNHPDNPRPTIYSAYRDYGRFGAFFTHTIKSGESLHLCYRIWIVGGEMPARERFAGKCSAFVDCPQVKVLD